MNILADENISRLLVERLRQEGHQVRYIVEMARGSDDPTVLEIANEQGSLLVTDDKDFGNSSSIGIFRHQEYFLFDWQRSHLQKRRKW